MKCEDAWAKRARLLQYVSIYVQQWCKALLFVMKLGSTHDQ